MSDNFIYKNSRDLWYWIVTAEHRFHCLNDIASISRQQLLNFISPSAWENSAGNLLKNLRTPWAFTTNYLKRTSTGDRWVGEVETFGWWYGCWYGRKPRLLLKLLLPAGDFDLSFFFKLKFSGAASSVAESSTSRSLSGELGDAWLRDGDSDNGIENLLLTRGLLGDDSEPVSWSVSADSRARLFPTGRNRKLVKLSTARVFFGNAHRCYEYLCQL